MHTLTDTHAHAHAYTHQVNDQYPDKDPNLLAVLHIFFHQQFQKKNFEDKWHKFFYSSNAFLLLKQQSKSTDNNLKYWLQPQKITSGFILSQATNQPVRESNIQLLVC